MKALTLLMIPAALFAGQGRRRDLPSAPFRGCWELRRKPTADAPWAMICRPYGLCSGGPVSPPCAVAVMSASFAR